MAERLDAHKVLVVTGSVPRAEALDRPLAYHLKAEIDRRGGRDPRRKALVVGDLWYLQNEQVHDQPTVSLGGPGVNALSAAFLRRLPLALAVENVFVLQMDATFKDLRVCVWGMNHERTKVALATFEQDRFLGRYLDAAWTRSKED